MQPSYLKCSKALRKTEREPEKLSILMFFLSQTAINVSVKLKLGWNINDVFKLTHLHEHDLCVV